MNSETVIKLCFIREEMGSFLYDVEAMLKSAFMGMANTCELEEKSIDGAQVINVEILVKSNWKYDAEVVNYIEDTVGEIFWQYLYGFQIANYPVVKECNQCGSH